MSQNAPEKVQPPKTAASPLGPPWTVGKLLAWTREHFTRYGVDQPRLASEILLAHALGCQKIQLYTQFEAEPAGPVLDRFRELVKRAAKREPIAYLVGAREFFSLNYEVGPGVLIPRPETEHVVEMAMEQINSRTPQPQNAEKEEGADAEVLDLPKSPDPPITGSPDSNSDKVDATISPTPSAQTPTPFPHPPITIWDLGCGSGCIGLTIAHLTRKHVPPVRVVLSDLSPAGVEISTRNAKRHKLTETVAIVHADGLNLPAEHIPAGGFDLLVSNPPYIAEPLRKTLEPELAYEPDAALFAGEDGLAFFRLLLRASPLLKKGGWLICEIGAGQEGAIEKLFTADGWKPGAVKKDWAGIVRVLSFQTPQA